MNDANIEEYSKVRHFRLLLMQDVLKQEVARVKEFSLFMVSELIIVALHGNDAQLVRTNVGVG